MDVLEAVLPKGQRIDGAYMIGMAREWAVPNIQKRLADLRAHVPMLQPFTAAALTKATDGPVVQPSLRVRHGIMTGERHSHNDIVRVGAVGVADSHAQIMGMAARGHVDGWTLVFEFDADIDKTGLAAFSKAVAGGRRISTDDPVGLILLGWHWYAPPAREPVAGMTALAHVTGTWFGTHAMLLRNRDAATYGAAIRTIEAHVDRQLGMAAQLGDVPQVWQTVPAVCGATDGLSGLPTTLHTRTPNFKVYMPADDVAMGFLLLTPYVVALALLITVIVVCTKRGRGTAG